MNTKKNKSKSMESTTDREIIISRVINAPRERVWEAVADTKQVEQWWGPNGFKDKTIQREFKPGGIWTHTMIGPDGTEYPNKCIFKEIVKPEKIVYSLGGGKRSDKGATFIATWTFEAQGNKTELTMHSIFPTAQARDHVVKEYKAIEGGNQTLARLDEFVSKKENPMSTKSKDFVISREFNAPREIVWKAFTDPKEMKKWWGPKGATVGTSKMDFRPGGVYLYSMKYPNAPEMWGKMVYREISAPEKIIFVNSFSDEKGGLARHPLSPTWPIELLSTITFTESKGKTTMTIRWSPLNPTPEERKTFDEGHGSMTQGWTGTLNQLDEYLCPLQGAKK